MYVKFNGNCLKQDKITFSHGKIVNIYIVYDLNSTLNYNDAITLENCLFDAAKIMLITQKIHVDNKKKRYFNSW